MSTVSVITPTGGRPEAYRLCELWMGRQTLKPMQHIVIDDCVPETEISVATTIIRPEIPWSMETGSTYCRNLLVGFRECKGDYICVIEDDDWFDPTYLEMMVGKMREGLYQAVGAAKRRYYNLPSGKYKNFYNIKFSSLTQTMFNREIMERIAVPALEHGERITFDVELWKQIMREYRRRDWLLFDDSNSKAVGIKGLPGRPGVTGHRTDDSWLRDRGNLKLRSWLGDDWEHYSPFLKNEVSEK